MTIRYVISDCVCFSAIRNISAEVDLDLDLEDCVMAIRFHRRLLVNVSITGREDSIIEKIVSARWWPVNPCTEGAQPHVPV